MTTSAEDYGVDPWPQVDGEDWNGENLLTLLHAGHCPITAFDVNILIEEIEDALRINIIDIPLVSSGANNYGFHMKSIGHPDVVARLAKADLNWPSFDDLFYQKQARDAMFEAATYGLLAPVSAAKVSKLIYHRLPVLQEGPRSKTPPGIAGRQLLIFDRAESGDAVKTWKSASQEGKMAILEQAAHMRAALFQFSPPSTFAKEWFLDRLVQQKPKGLSAAVIPNRDFCVSLLSDKIEATIRNIGDMIGWPSDNATVGPVAFAAKHSLLKLIPYLLPAESEEVDLYRLVLDHGDFGIHNMTITMNADGQPIVTSIFDWETGSIVPAMLSDPEMVVTVDLIIGKDSQPSFERVKATATEAEREEFARWTRKYFRALFEQIPEYVKVIKAGKDARKLWFALRDWRGQDPEGYFGELGKWAENRLKELSDD